LQEYSSILGQTTKNVDGLIVDINKLKGNKYYQNHLKALELQRQQELEETNELKVKMMRQADMMLYDDDFDEESMFSGSYTGKRKY
jgi:hypothetical protein